MAKEEKKKKNPFKRAYNRTNLLINPVARHKFLAKGIESGAKKYMTTADKVRKKVVNKLKGDDFKTNEGPGYFAGLPEHLRKKKEKQNNEKNKNSRKNQNKNAGFIEREEHEWGPGGQPSASEQIKKSKERNKIDESKKKPKYKKVTQEQVDKKVKEMSKSKYRRTKGEGIEKKSEGYRGDTRITKHLKKSGWSETRLAEKRKAHAEWKAKKKNKNKLKKNTGG